MLKKLIKSERFIEFLRFSVNGAVCFLIDWSVMMLLMRFTGLPDWLSIAAGFLVSVVVNYLICIFWVFGGTKNQTVISKIIFLGSSVAGLFLTELLMLLLIPFISPAIAKFIVAVIVMIWNYIMKRIALYGFKKRKNLR